MIKVIIIDDSAMVRKVISKEISASPDIEVVATAPDPFIGRDKIIKYDPDVILLDVEMPKMDGLTFLKKLMKSKPMPVIIVSSLAKHSSEVALKALEYGAVEVLAKPGGSFSVKDMGEQLIDKIKAAYQVKLSNKLFIPKEEVQVENYEKKYNQISYSLRTTNKIIAIGASTGGTEAIKSVLRNLPVDIPPIVIVQHMPEFFTKSFSDSLNRICKIEVKEAENNDKLIPGRALIAPGNIHMIVHRSGAEYYVKLKMGDQVYHQRPSVEVMFYSIAKNAAKNTIGVILTGMGKDGAKGLLEMKNKGSFTIAQDEKSSVVFGMPKEAIDIGAVDAILPLNRIPGFIIEKLKTKEFQE